MKDHTTVTIAGAKTTLAFGVRFDVELERHVLRDALLDGRAPNGDLIFRLDPDQDGANGGVQRVRPSTIHGIVGSGVEHLRPDGTLRYAVLGDAADVSAEVSEARGKCCDLCDVIVDQHDAHHPAGTGCGCLDALDDMHLGHKRDLESELAAGVRLADALAADFDGDPDAADKVAARVLEERPLLGFTDGPSAGESAGAYLARAETTLGRKYVWWLGTEVGQAALAAAAAESAAARNGKAKLVVVKHDDSGLPPAARRKGPAPYAERNQVWRCGTCKTRTRAATCARGHDPVDAPAGKRRDSR